MEQSKCCIYLIKNFYICFNTFPVVMLREILLVEDNPADARLTMIALEECRISNSIVHVKDGEEALDYIFCRGAFSNRNRKDLPVLVLLDLKMPKVDGIEVVKRIK